MSKPSCPACPLTCESMDALVDHVSDDHGWAVAASLGEGSP